MTDDKLKPAGMNDGEEPLEERQHLEALAERYRREYDYLKTSDLNGDYLLAWDDWRAVTWALELIDELDAENDRLLAIMAALPERLASYERDEPQNPQAADKESDHGSEE